MDVLAYGFFCLNFGGGITRTLSASYAEKGGSRNGEDSIYRLFCADDKASTCGLERDKRKRYILGVKPTAERSNGCGFFLFDSGIYGYWKEWRHNANIELASVRADVPEGTIAQRSLEDLVQDFHDGGLSFAGKEVEYGQN